MLSSRDPDKKTDQSSVRSIALQIKAEKGWQGFWSGYSASLILTLNPSLTFFFYEFLKNTVLPHRQRSSPSAQATFLLAAISKAMASTITYPFSLAKSRLQASSKPNEEQKTSTVKLESSSSEVRKKARNNVFTMILQLARTEGIGALYEGLGGEVMKGFFSQGITMIVKEAVHKLVIQTYYAILKLLKKYPVTQELAESTKGQAEQVADGLEEATQQAAVTATEAGKQVKKGSDDS